MYGFSHRDAKLCFGEVLSQPQSALNTMQKKGNKKAQDVEEESDLEIMPRIEIIYEDTKAVTGVELELK